LKACVLTRTYTATDDCGNSSSIEQTITLIGDCCEKKDGEKSMEVSVTPNPFRTECVIAFRAMEEGRAVITVTDLNGRPVTTPIAQDVYAGHDVRIPFSAHAVEMGVYLYRVMVGERVATGRLIVQ
jgi:hypothetical protein